MNNEFIFKNKIQRERERERERESKRVGKKRQHLFDRLRSPICDTVLQCFNI